MAFYLCAKKRPMKLNLINNTIIEDKRTEYGTMMTINNKAGKVRIK